MTLGTKSVAKPCDLLTDARPDDSIDVLSAFAMCLMKPSSLEYELHDRGNQSLSVSFKWISTLLLMGELEQLSYRYKYMILAHRPVP